MFFSLLICILGLIRVVKCAWPGGDEFLYWIWQSAVVVDSSLYIDGGEYYTSPPGGSVTMNELGTTLFFDLGQSWSISSVEPQNISKPAGMAGVRRPPLWYDPTQTLLMQRGGWGYDTDSSYLWSLDASGAPDTEWVNNEGSPAAQQLDPTFGGAFTASTTHFYSLGGADVSSGGGDPSEISLAIEGLTVFDFESGVWHNKSSLESSSQGGYSVQAQATFMPNFGQAGLLAFLGGDSPPNQTYQYEAGAALVDMSNITIYDPTSNTFYHQTATGAVPPPRSEFCAVSTSAADNSTTEIYVFGGSTNTTFDTTAANDDGYLDVYILSLPSFTWFAADALTEARRANHFCQVLGQGSGQMLVIGGRDPSFEDIADGIYFWNGADPWTRGMNIFDMTSLTWTADYNPSTTYERPAMVQKHYANNANNATWSDPALAALFVPKPPSATSSVTPTSTPAARHKHHSNVGAIVGGVVAAVLIVLIVLVVAFCLMRHRRHSRARRPMPTWQDSHEMPHEQKYEMDTPFAKTRTENAVELPAAEFDEAHTIKRRPM